MFAPDGRNYPLIQKNEQKMTKMMSTCLFLLQNTLKNR